MCRTFEQVINSMSDTEFDKLIDSVKGLRGTSMPVSEYFDQVEHLVESTGQREAMYEYNIKIRLEEVSNIESALAA